MPDEQSPDTGDAPEHFTLFTEGDRLYDAMLAKIASAHSEILLESYIFADDEIGRRFARKLSEKARAGILVRVHIDAAGSLFWSTRSFMNDMAVHGVQVRWFHRWDWRRPWRYNRRNHRKLLVIDGQTAWAGGFNIHRENSLSLHGPRRWRDTHVCFNGELATQARQLFDDFWHRRKRVSPPYPAADNSLLISNYAHGSRRYMNGLIRHLIAGAQYKIHLTTPYFVPDLRTQRLLSSAARHGIEVRLLVPGKSDIRIARWAARAGYTPLLDSGVQIHEYLPRLLHAKTVVVDGSHALIGTSNIDYRSFFLNYELNLFTQNAALCRQLESRFSEDLQSAEKISVTGWKRRFWGGRILELVGWLARRWL